MKTQHNRGFSRHGAQTRDGIATVEFVLAFPFIVGVGVVAVGIAVAGIRKAQVITAARRDAWNAAKGQNAPNPLSIGANLEAGNVEKSASRSVAVPSVLGGSATATSRANRHAGDWSSPAADFSSTRDFEPHRQPTRAILSSAGGAAGGQAADGLDGITTFLRNVVQVGKTFGGIAQALDFPLPAAGKIITTFTGSDNLEQAAKR